MLVHRTTKSFSLNMFTSLHCLVLSDHLPLNCHVDDDCPTILRVWIMPFNVFHLILRKHIYSSFKYLWSHLHTANNNWTFITKNVRKTNRRWDWNVHLCHVKQLPDLPKLTHMLELNILVFPVLKIGLWWRKVSQKLELGGNFYNVCTLKPKRFK